MRYQDWDVLLFPENSKVPIQEFKTQCHVTRDLDSPFVNSSTFSGVPFASDGPPIIQLPVLTSFIPSLLQHAPFRVSIHSWDKPKPSRMMESLVSPEHAIIFQARVYVDGVLIADSIFDKRTVWPYVLGSSGQLDAVGDEIPLTFPKFHPEILHQAHWEAGELLGRIKIVIAEGFSRDISVPHGKQSYFFDRAKDVVAFSFQHAPLNILEFSGIAWPNAGMWQIGPTQTVNRGAPRGSRSLHPEDSHAHSPRQPSGWASRAMLPPLAPTSDPTSARYGITTPLPTTSGLPLSEDPFTDLRKTNAVFRRSKKSTVDDTPMPDYVSTSTERSRAYSDMTGLSYERKKETSDTTLTVDGPSLGELIHKFSPEKAREILIAASTPPKSGNSGIAVPTNSPSSTVELPTQPSTKTPLPNSKAAVDGTGRGREQGASPGSASSSQISPTPAEIALPRTVTKDASPISSVAGKQRATLDNEDLIQGRSTSFELTRSTSTSLRLAVSSMATPIFLSSDTNRPRSDSNGSKRKRSSPSPPKTTDGEIDPGSLNKEAPRETAEASTH